MFEKGVKWSKFKKYSKKHLVIYRYMIYQMYIYNIKCIYVYFSPISGMSVPNALGLPKHGVAILGVHQFLLDNTLGVHLWRLLDTWTFCQSTNPKGDKKKRLAGHQSAVFLLIFEIEISQVMTNFHHHIKT